MIALLALLAPAQASNHPPACEFNYPIAGSAGFENAQAARKTNVNTYGASAYAERIAQQSAQYAPADLDITDEWGFAAIEANWTMGAARVPTFCDDDDPGEESVYGINSQDRWKRKERVYEQPLDLYATTMALGLGFRGAGAFYAASVTQSVLGWRAWVIPTQMINLYPLTFAPLVGNTSRGDGVASYTVDWIGGAYVDTRLVGARVGYTGIDGIYGSVDERIVGLFGTFSARRHVEVDPIEYLRAGLQDFSLRRFGATKAADAIGSTSLFFRDLPVAGDEAGADPAANRLKTVHLQQKSIAQHGEIDLTAALGEERSLYEGHIGLHSPGFYRDRATLKGGADVAKEGFLLKAGVVNLPPRYALGVEGGRFLALRGEVHSGPVSGAILFNDPEQLALFPFATNALSLKLSVSTIGLDVF